MLFRALTLAALLPVGAFIVHDWPQNYDAARNVSGTSLELQEGKVFSIASNAMHFRKDIFDSIKSGGTKQFFEAQTHTAWYRKFGVAKVPGTIKVAGKEIGAGEWTLSIKVPLEDTTKFVMEWKNGEKKVDVPLDFKPSGGNEDHLLLALTPRGGKGSFAFELKVWYGDVSTAIPGEIVTAAAQ